MPQQKHSTHKINDRASIEHVERPMDLEKNLEATITSKETLEPKVVASESAKAAYVREHQMGIMEGIRLHWKAMGFSVGISLCIIMEGYDLGHMSNFFALLQFRQRYGKLQPNGDYQVSIGWQSALSAISSVGAIVGLLVVGQLVEQVGFRRSMATALVMIAGMTFITFFANNVVTLFIGQLLFGIPVGMFQGMASTYAADVAPLVLRPFLTSYINLCWGLGQFIVTGVLRGCLTLDNEWAYRIPFAIQWVWIFPIATVVFFAPESPWWLVRKGRLEDARAALDRLAGEGMTSQDIERSLQLMVLTDEQERCMQEGTSYLDLFKGVNLRRTEIAALTWTCQVTCGTWFSSQIGYFMSTAGIGSATALNFAIGMTAVNCVGTMCSWFLSARIGRRPMFLWGLIGMFVTEMIVGFLGIPNSDRHGLLWASAAMLIVNNVIYFLSIGPVAFTIVADMPAVRLRQRTIAFARATYLAAATGANFLQPALINPTAWNLGAKGAFVWAGICFLSVIYIFFRLPESRKRMPIEMNLLFDSGIPARKFKTTVVDV